MRRILIALAVSAATMLPVTAHAQICAPFTDVPASNIFCGNIQWMLNRGITSGCGTNLYCPNDVMPRDQMAAFMNRLADRVTFQQGGNAFAAPAELGTTDNQVLEVIVNNSRVMRYEPSANSPNLIGGSSANSVTAGVIGATIGGGGVNRVTDDYGTVGGGSDNRAGDDAAPTTDAEFATVGGGSSNTAGGGRSTVAGGILNTASGFNSTVAGGFGNTAGGNSSTVAGGLNNTAAGFASFAAGRAANADATGCFVWGDASTGNEINCALSNRFVVRSVGGVFFLASGDSGPTYTGVVLFPGATAWVPHSDRRIKDNLREIDTQDVLQRLLSMPVTTWNLKAQDPSIRHMGPMAQDFRVAFGLGETDLGINTLDADGVAFAAIQGLNAKLEATLAERDARIAALAQELAQERTAREAQRREIAELRQAFGALLAATKDADRIAARSR